MNSPISGAHGGGGHPRKCQGMTGDDVVLSRRHHLGLAHAREMEDWDRWKHVEIMRLISWTAIFVQWLR